ncbi:tol-pal system protein YbgF [Oxalobacteraceae bacterium CAVE-383]|nr:tol-pal system protein YbgF [Oxalobacteraceae bacterium CAVE-383]
MRIFYKSALGAALAAAFSCAPMAAHAGLFDDAEARKAILDMRTQIQTLQHDMGDKADKSSTLTLADQNEQLRQEIARLRGQIEVLTNQLSDAQQRQKDFYVDLDTRLRKLEPQQVTIDGKDVSVDINEQKSFTSAQALLNNGDYKGAASAFSDFLKRYPQSGYAASAQFFLGNAYYGQGDYKNTVAALQGLMKNYPDNPKVPDAQLLAGSSYLELKDKTAAKKMFSTLISQHPDAPAAKTAKERLAGIK